MKEYWKNLKQHAGLDMAFMMTILCLMAGVSRKDVTVLQGVIIGLIPSAIIWSVVLITNYTNNKNKGDEEK